MKKLETYAPSLLRVDFADDLVWGQVRDAALVPRAPGDLPNLVAVEDRDFEGVDFAQCLRVPDGYEPRVLVVFDEQSRTQPDHPLLIVDRLALAVEGHEDAYAPATFRTVPAQVQSIEANLSLANMDFEDFRDRADPDGIFRGFR